MNCTAGYCWYTWVYVETERTCFCTAAGTNVTVEVQFVNTGNVHLRVDDVVVNDISNLVCKPTTHADTTDFTSLGSTAVNFNSNVQVDFGTKLVCQGTFTFSQGVLDANTADRKTFTPTATLTNADPLAEKNSVPPSSYSATVDVSITSIPALRITIDVVNCTKPSIIPHSEPGAPPRGDKTSHIHHVCMTLLHMVCRCYVLLDVHDATATALLEASLHICQLLDAERACFHLHNAMPSSRKQMIWWAVKCAASAAP